jgi:hypothetical protein
MTFTERLRRRGAFRREVVASPAGLRSRSTRRAAGAAIAREGRLGSARQASEPPRLRVPGSLRWAAAFLARRRAPPLLLAIVLASGCSGPPAPGSSVEGDPPGRGTARVAVDSPPAPGAAPAEPPTDGGEWTLEPLSGTHEPGGVATLVAARIARNEGFDRLVLEFDEAWLPSWTVGYSERPILQCGSGEPVEIGGAAALRVHLEPARAHDDQGRVTLEERSFRSALPVILEARLICDFEAHVEWAVGTTSPAPFRVLELADPTRLVIDFRH